MQRHQVHINVFPSTIETVCHLDNVAVVEFEVVLEYLGLFLFEVQPI